MNIDKAFFPPRPAYAGTLAPLYLEPIPGSGERITIAIVALGEDNAMRIHPVIHHDALTCLYGNKAKNLQGMIELCASSLRGHLENNGNTSNWLPPITTATLGKPRQAYAESMTAMIGQGIRMHASLGVLPSEADEIDTDTTEERRHWDDDIRQAANPLIQPYFGKSVQLTSASTRQARIGFIHPRYAASFALLTPGASLGTAINTAKAKLWNLKMLHGAPEVHHRGEIELLIGHASPDFDPSMSKKAVNALHDAVNELREESMRSDLGLHVVHNHAAAAEHIFKRVA